MTLKNIVYKQLNGQDTWTKAAVIGTIWASFEIIFGSFLHALRIPLAGTTLTFFSIILLTAFAQKFKGKNLFLKAGIIAALLRSVMPTSIILGPLLGILTEALLFQFFYNLFRGRFPGFALAAIFSMFAALLHKIISILLIYGFDIVKILKNLYFIFLKTSGLNLPPKDLLIIIPVIYSGMGIIAAFIGRITARKTKPVSEQPDFNPDFRHTNGFLQIHPGFHYNRYFIFLHLILFVLILSTSERLPVYISLSIMIAYFVIIGLRYGKYLRRLRSKIFYVQLIFIFLMSLLLIPDQKEAVVTGLRMIIRAMTIISAFTAIGIELRNPLIVNTLKNKGLEELYQAVQVSSELFPAMANYLKKDKKAIFHPLRLLRKSIAVSEMLIRQIKTSRKPVVILVSGPSGSGKTTAVSHLWEAIKNDPEWKNKTAGIIAPVHWKNNKPVGYDAMCVPAEKKFFTVRLINPGAKNIKRYHFDEKSFNIVIRKCITKLPGISLFLLDEMGPLEIKHKGWHPLIQKVFDHRIPVQVWTVRPALVKTLKNKYSGSLFIDIQLNSKFFKSPS